jgi:MFS family permease
MRRTLISIYTMQSMVGFASSLIGIFVPVYLLKNGGSVRVVMLYFLIYSVTVFGGTLVAGIWLSSKYNLKHLLLIRLPFLFAFLALLNNGDIGIKFIIALALLQGIQAALYWLPLHIYFAMASSEKAVGSQVGNLFTIPKLVALAAPVLAGLLISRFGFGFIFLASGLIYSLSTIPLVYAAEYKPTSKLSAKVLLGLLSTHRNYFYSEIFENITEELDQIIWPLAIYLTLKSTVSLGLAGTLISIGGAAFTYTLGRWIDKGNKYQLLRLGAIVMIALWVARLWVNTTAPVLIVTVLVGFFELLLMIPFNTFIYDFARENNTREFILFREFPVVIARIIVYSLGIALALQPRWLFWLAIVAYAYFLVMPKLKNEKNKGVSRD